MNYYAGTRLWVNEKPNLEAIRPAWQRQGLCVGRDDVAFFPERGESTAEAKTLCCRCPVVDKCLDYALSCGPSLQGIWAGTSQRERRHLGKIISSGGRGMGSVALLVVARTLVVSELRISTRVAEKLFQEHQLHPDEVRAVIEDVGRLPFSWDYDEEKGWRALIFTVIRDEACLVVLYAAIGFGSEVWNLGSAYFPDRDS